METVETLEQKLARYKEIDELNQKRVKISKEERFKKVIDAENKMNLMGNKFISFLESKPELLTKKLFLTDGSLSKMFKEVFEQFKEQNGINAETHYNFYLNTSYKTIYLKQSINVWGGEHRNRELGLIDTYYNDTVNNSKVIFNYDGDFTKLSLEKNNDVVIYDFDTTITTEKLIEEKQAELKRLSSEITELTNLKPYHLKKHVTESYYI